MNKNIRIGITHGDINGVSYEVIMKAFADNRILEDKTVIVYGSAKAAAFHRKQTSVQNFNFHQIKSADEAQDKFVNIINCGESDLRVDLGQETEEAGRSAYDALQEAVKDLKSNKIDVIVTAPINKHTISKAGFTFPGHTEFFASESETDQYLMLLINDLMRVGVVAGHVPLSEVPSHITAENIMSKLEVLNSTLQVDFNIRKPRIAVLGLNPHAGDNGLLGDEEEKIIKPVLEEARKNGIMALGPYAADGFFGAAQYRSFDAILGMYHDQILTPFKALDFESAVNYTAGLPIIRVSPGHGTAYNIAGKDEASEKSLQAAVFMACDIYSSRKNNQELKHNQLK
ncbi:MAG: 4-hydroxythreonine-4-phosphate dehydrogenase PdxA [Bacteroidales bacterium]|jgi:4-hydroxythreonine-4-phosphate dehydrogenase|nr:4-hydroxythreonine-4-phosphate dehydrogenase PdxA [Bacteroidales bacterium]